MCTSFRVTATDGAVVVGRTMEFPNLMGARLVVTPRETTGTSVAPDGPGKTWTARFGFVGIDGFGDPQKLSDGLNEAGLYANLQYMPGFCDYESADGVDDARLMAIPDLVAFVLATCADVAEVRTALAGVVVWPWEFGPFGTAPPSHLVVHDRTGAAVVVEWVAGEQVVFDNPLGVATNAPHFDWHLTNLATYVGLSPVNPGAVTVDGTTISPLGQGTGMRGLPGDSTSPSRFVRAVAASTSLRPVADGAAAEVTALHVLDGFDIPWGMVRGGTDPGEDDHTLWSTIANLTDGAYIVRTYEDPVPRRIALCDLDFSMPAPVTAPLPTRAEFPKLAIHAPR